MKAYDDSARYEVRAKLIETGEDVFVGYARYLHEAEARVRKVERQKRVGGDKRDAYYRLIVKA